MTTLAGRTLFVSGGSAANLVGLATALAGAEGPIRKLDSVTTFPGVAPLTCPMAVEEFAGLCSGSTSATDQRARIVGGLASGQGSSVDSGVRSGSDPSTCPPCA